MSDTNRREFLVTIAAGTAAAATTCLLPSCGVDPAPAAKAGAVDAAGQVKFAPGTIKQLEKIGGAVLLSAGGISRPILVMRVSADEYRATSGICTHASCPVGYVPERKIIECPCHGAQFNLDGSILRRPATTRLSAFPVRTDPVSGEIVVDTNGDRVPVLENGQVVFAVDHFSSLEVVDGIMIFTPIGLPDPLLVLRYDSAHVYAYDAHSTAARCILGYSPDRRRLTDPCTGSEFDIDGTIRNGPAKVPLKRYATTFDGTTITIQIA
ncbi:MAG: Rieske (2Fe-2S) protein [Deltaproteobacteria bacterium]|nr:Rieske (2Fe-2S) protein [Deltaproteobacteria bacterium]